ncbi:TRAP transporter large permease [Fodinicurvata sp. EGI_FJ10296]|uniref:TRAP transporter large permease n=1 Tax=Fodinicurvata sp. EGI_FJ10296 TaxID=3231908 RepID=UPI003455F06D
MNAAMALTMGILFMLGVPIAVGIAMAAVVAIEYFTRLPLLLVAQRMFTGIDSFTLMAIPFFILAGNLMSAGGISERLVDFAKSIVGGVRGGLACTCVLTCMIFASVSGSSVATTFAIGAILIPAMVRDDYPKPFAASVQASSASLGVLIPPSIPLILYGVATETSIGQLFIAGIGPGLVVGIALMVFVHIVARIKGYGERPAEDRLGVWTAFKRALWALIMPFVVIGGIYGGVFTPTEASAVAVFYALIVGMFVYRRLKPRDLPEILRNSMVATSVIMLIIAAAALFSFVLTRAGVPAEIARWVTQVFNEGWTFLLAVNVVLLLVGMFIETSAAIIVLAPILLPIAVSFGLDPVHFGMIMVVNLALGMFTPPLGVNMFAASQVARLPVDRFIIPLLPFVLVMLACLMIITYIPFVTLVFRDLLYGG